MLVYLIGILPMTNFKTVSRFSAMCGASIPNWLADLFDGLEGDKGTLSLVAGFGRYRTMPSPARQRHRSIPLLHHEQS